MTCSSLNTQVWYFFNALFPFLRILLPTTTTHACLNYAFMRYDRMKLLFRRSDFIAPLPPCSCIFQYIFPAKETTMVNLIVFKSECPLSLSQSWHMIKNQNFSYSSQRYPRVSLETWCNCFLEIFFWTRQKIKNPLRSHVWSKTRKFQWLIPYHKLRSV